MPFLTGIAVCIKVHSIVEILVMAWKQKFGMSYNREIPRSEKKCYKNLSMYKCWCAENKVTLRKNYVEYTIKEKYVGKKDK